MSIDDSGYVVLVGCGYAAKLNPDGVLCWKDQLCDPVAVASDSAGKVYVAGTVRIGGSDTDIKIIKYSDPPISFPDYAADTIAGGTYLSLIAGDFNNDGFPDVAVGNSSTGTVTIIENQNGLPGDISTYYAGQYIYQVATGDIDGDGSIDIVARGAFGTYVLWNKGNGIFDTSVTTAGNYLRLAVVDLDKDGRADIAGTVSPKSVEIRWGSASRVLETQAISALTIYPVEIGAFDITGDNRLDLVLASHGNNSGHDSIGTIINLGGRSFVSGPGSEAGYWPSSICGADFDKDGDLDLAVSPSTPLLLKNNGNGEFTATEIPSQGGEGMYAADFDGDGTSDILNCSGKFSILRNNGKGEFWRAIVFGPESVNLAQAISVDLDKDGDNDVVTVSADNGNVLFYYNKGLNSHSIDAPESNSDLITLPKVTSLHQNYPNPFNPSTMIEFDLPCRGKIEIVIYNILGQAVSTLIDGEYSAGHYSVIWDGTAANNQRAASGIYFYRIQAGDYVETKKMILLK